MAGEDKERKTTHEGWFYVGLYAIGMMGIWAIWIRPDGKEVWENIDTRT